ncbi:MAG: YeeE/YedE family protein [Desulfobulbaceae bacterium]
MFSGFVPLIAAGFFLGLAAGWVMYRSDFCVAGMFRDLFLFRRTVMLRSLLLLIVTTMILVELLRRGGLIGLYPFPTLGSPSPGNLAGGIVFGAGMVLAGGCAAGTLYKMGGGSVTSCVAFIGMIAGSGMYAEFHPSWKKVLDGFTFLKPAVTLPQALHCDPALVILPIGLVSGLLFLRWRATDSWHVASRARGHLQPWKAALCIALLGTLSYLLVGMPFGVTTSFAKAAAFLTSLAAPEHASAVPFYQGVPLDYAAPFTGQAIRGGPGPRLDGIALIQFPLITGIILGAMAAALRVGEFRPYFRIPPRQYVSAFAGGILLALGSRMTPGCNVWHLFGGLPILTMQSFLFLFGLIPGAWLGSRLLTGLVLSSRPTPKEQS